MAKPKDGPSTWRSDDLVYSKDPAVKSSKRTGYVVPTNDTTTATPEEMIEEFRRYFGVDVAARGDDGKVVRVAPLPEEPVSEFVGYHPLNATFRSEKGKPADHRLVGSWRDSDSTLSLVTRAFCNKLGEVIVEKKAPRTDLTPEQFVSLIGQVATLDLGKRGKLDASRRGKYILHIEKRRAGSKHPAEYSLRLEQPNGQPERLFPPLDPDNVQQNEAASHRALIKDSGIGWAQVAAETFKLRNLLPDGMRDAGDERDDEDGEAVARRE